MAKHIFGVIFTVCLYIEAQSFHEYGLQCSGSTAVDKILYTFDHEVAGYLENQTEVVTVPDIAGVTTFMNQNDIAHITNICEFFFKLIVSRKPFASEPLEPPWSTIYPRNYVRLNVTNTLICLVTGLFPPPVRVSWTKNNLNVTDEATLSQYYLNQDGTLNVFSRLSFIPEEGDIYSCSVEHKALQEPQTRTWEVEIKESSIGPSVFCGVGVALGLLGLITAAFFIAKGKNCN